MERRRSAAAALAAAFLGGALAGGVAVSVLGGASPASASLAVAASGVERPGAGPSRSSAAHYPAEVIQVVDGDTFVARVKVWPGLDVTTKVRLRGIDAPELHTRCAREEALARRAREALAAILAEGEVAIGHVSPDKYGGRVLATAATQRTPDVSAALLAAGLARAYAGGRRGSWCATAGG